MVVNTPPAETSQLMQHDVWLFATAVVSALISGLVSLFVTKWQTRDKLRVEYEHEQRREIRQLLGRYHGRLLQACVHLHHRMWNLYDNHERNWLGASAPYTNPGYYLLSTVHRFLGVCCLCRRLEHEAIYLDARIARKEDLTFLKIAAAIPLVMTDVSLFDGLSYDHEYATDHFFADELRRTCDSCYVDDNPISHQALESRLRSDRSLDSLIEFFCGLTANEERYRWDRMVALHLLIVAFINTFGYREQRATGEQISMIVAQFRRPQVAANLAQWIQKCGLSDTRAIGDLTSVIAGTALMMKPAVAGSAIVQ